MEEIIKDLEDKIKMCKTWDLDVTNWRHEKGVLITANQAKQIVEALKKRNTLAASFGCSACGSNAKIHVDDLILTSQESLRIDQSGLTMEIQL